ncbi:hypothetical protein BCR43DRAFT_481512 [Syncephalastrum racemosum]|uniref:Uncharacterized protein n=1 Tax=Syncephalastrum racemosum TaxID=13706 RepID=A0A1X2HS45_SYNRA|nr:hypothetical protein BCR43DRAFT_481512 [Syncephalastrum racemosum]
MSLTEAQDTVGWLKQPPQTRNSHIYSTPLILDQQQAPAELFRGRRPISTAMSSIDSVSFLNRALSPSPTPSVSSLSSTGSDLYKRRSSARSALLRQQSRTSQFEPVTTTTTPITTDTVDAASTPSTPTPAPNILDPDTILTDRLMLAEKQLAEAQTQVLFYKQQLSLHDKETQKILHACMADKEKEAMKAQQLCEVVETQDALILQLQEKLTHVESLALVPLTPDQEVRRLRQQINDLVSEKRSLEQRMAAFLHDELDHVSQDGSITAESKRRSSILDDPFSLATFGYANSNRSSDLLAPTRLNTLNLVEERDEEEDAVSGYSSIASSPNPYYYPSTLSSPTSPQKTSLRSAVTLPPATPPPSLPLPPLPPLPSTQDQEDTVSLQSTPPASPLQQRMHRSMSPLRISTNPLALSLKHSSADALAQHLNPSLSSPLYHASTAEGRSSLPTTSKSSSLQHMSGHDANREKRNTFWKDMKKKWKSR